MKDIDEYFRELVSYGASSRSEFEGLTVDLC
jgi:hypothetical protein